MLTKKVKNRILFLTFLISISIIIIFFIIDTLKDNLLYFKTPSDIMLDNNIKIGTPLRLGGMVKKDSIITTNDEIRFVITDFKNEIIVTYKGSVPNLFSEEKGAIAEGKLKDKKFFIANRILAKHDENYMPPQIKKLSNKNAK